MNTALAIVELDDNDHCLPQPPLQIIERASPAQIIENLDKLIDGYPVRDAAYNALLKIRFLADKLYHDTANPNAPNAGYSNIAGWFLLSNYDNMLSQIKGTIKQRQQARLEAADGFVQKGLIMGQNAKENTGMGLVFSALDFVKEYIRGSMSKDFQPEEFENVLQTLQQNKPIYATELKAVNESLRAVFTSPDAAFADVSKINALFEKAHQSIISIEESDFKN